MACIDEFKKESQEYKDCIAQSKKKEDDDNSIDPLASLGIKDFKQEEIIYPSAEENKEAVVGANTKAMKEMASFGSLGENLKKLLPTFLTNEGATETSDEELVARAKRDAERKAIAEGDKKLSFLESVKNSGTNFLLQLQGVDDRAQWLWAYAGKLDAQMGYGGKEKEDKYTKMMQGSESELQQLESESKSTIGFTDLGNENLSTGEKVLGGAAATINAISSFGASAVTSIATGGVGLASDMISGSVRDFNNQKAEALGITVEELIDSGQSEIMTPALIGGVGFALEKAGLKGVTGAINAMAIGPKRALIKVLNASAKEGGTEWLQTGLDEMNTLIAKGMDKTIEIPNPKGGTMSVPNPEIMALVWKKMGSKEGIESLLQGMVGGGVSAGGGRSIKKINRINGQTNIRSSEDNAAVSSLVTDIDIAENALARKNLSPEDRKMFQDFNNEKKQELKNIQKKSVDLVNELDDAQVTELNANSDIIAETLTEVDKINKNDTFTVNERSSLVTALNKKAKVAQQNNYDIKNQAELKLQEKRKPKTKVEQTQEDIDVNNQLDEIAAQAEANIIEAKEEGSNLNPQEK